MTQSREITFFCCCDRYHSFKSYHSSQQNPHKQTSPIRYPSSIPLPMVKKARRTPRLRDPPQASTEPILPTGPRGDVLESRTTSNNTPPRPRNSGHRLPNARQQPPGLPPPPIPGTRPTQFHSQSQPQLPPRVPFGDGNSATSSGYTALDRPAQIDNRSQQHGQFNASQQHSPRGRGSSEQTQRRPYIQHARSAPTRQNTPPGPFRINVEGFPRVPQTLEVMSIFQHYGKISYIGIYPKNVAVEFE